MVFAHQTQETSDNTKKELDETRVRTGGVAGEKASSGAVVATPLGLEREGGTANQLLIC